MKNKNKIQKVLKERKINSINYFKVLGFFSFLFIMISNEKNENNFKYYLELLYYLNKNIKYFLEKKINLNQDIIDSHHYLKFEGIKSKYNNNEFLYNYLNQITILSHIYHKNIIKLKERKNNIHISMGTKLFI